MFFYFRVEIDELAYIFFGEHQRPEALLGEIIDVCLGLLNEIIMRFVASLEQLLHD